MLSITIKGALDNLGLNPDFFFQKSWDFLYIPVEVYTFVMTAYLTLVLLRGGGLQQPPKSFRPGAQNRTAKG